jgi:hypothetical protein
MDTVLKMCLWVLANQGGSTSTAYTSIVNYYAAKNIDLSVAMS